MRSCQFHLALALGLLVAACAISAIPAVDMHVSQCFFDAQHNPPWVLTHEPWVQELYRYGPIPAWIMAIGAAVAFFVKQWQSQRRRFLILVLAVLLGPGLIVNWTLKPLWGRARPVDTVQFGGEHPYQAWYQPAGPTSDVGHSFVSGHVSMAFVLIAGGLVLPKRRRRWRYTIVTAAVLYGLLMAAARMAKGAHWPSDVMIAAALTYLVIAVLLTLLPIHEQPDA